MIVNSPTEDLSRRVCASVSRVVKVDGLCCDQDDEKLLLRGSVASKDDAMMCIVVARSVPGASHIINKIKVAR